MFYKLPWWLRVSHRFVGEDVYFVTLIGLASLVRWWFYRKALFFLPLMWLGVWSLKPGGEFTKGKLSWPWKNPETFHLDLARDWRDIVLGRTV